MDSINNRYISVLESRLDFLETELTGLDLLLKKVGFSEGIITLKESAKEILREDGVFEIYNQNQFEE